MVTGMELRHLRYFVGVAEELNFTRASHKLRIAQPALSRQIRDLEEEVGGSLFDRNRQGLVLTEVGKVFLAEARKLLAQSEQALLEAQKLCRAEQGTLNVGYVWGLFHSTVPAVISQFRRQYPRIAVNLFDLTSMQQVEALAKGKIDAGFIGFTHEADAASLAKRKVATCQFVAVLPQDHSLARKRCVALSHLSHEFFVVISGKTYPGAARLVGEICQRAGFRPRIVQAAERGYTLLGLVASHCGISILPEPLKALPHPGVVFRPLQDSCEVDLFVAWDASRRSKLREALCSNLATFP
jgi:DNA-binding transcriptional LysR family regulator